MEASKNSKKQEISFNSVSNQEKEILEGGAFNPVQGEMSLWSAVITQALMDAGSESKKAEARKEKAKAIRWLLGNSADFQIVCLNAGMNPTYVRQKALEAIGRNCSWRRVSAETRHEKSLSPHPQPLSIKQHHVPECTSYQAARRPGSQFAKIPLSRYPVGLASSTGSLVTV